MTDDKLDRTLKHHFSRETAEDGARVITKLRGPLPRQKRATWWPQVLLDWQFTPAWPRMVALAGCAALGFIVGSATVDHLIVSASADVALTAFEPEPLTGLRP
jgi:hypothetical protein